MTYEDGLIEPVVFCAHTVAAGRMSNCEKTRYPASNIENIVLVALRKQLELFHALANELKEDEEKNQNSLSAIRKNLEDKLEKLKAERVRQYEAYAQGVIGREIYLAGKEEINEKIQKLQGQCEELQTITTDEDVLMKEIGEVENTAKETQSLKKMTRQIAEAFVDEIIIYDSERVEIKFIFDDLMKEIADRIKKKKTEEIA